MPADTAIPMLADIAVVAENLKSFWEIMVLKPAIHVDGFGSSLAAVDFVSMLRPIVPNMVDSEH